jgi:hypothetical protein
MDVDACTNESIWIYDVLRKRSLGQAVYKKQKERTEASRWASGGSV